MDSIPLVILTGQVPTAMIGNDAFQEADIVGITRPCTKHNYLVRDVNDLSTIIKEAFYIASTGKPGPVLIDLPKDVMAASTIVKHPEKVHIRGYQPTYEGHIGQVKKASDALMAAKRPILFIGGGIILSSAYIFARKNEPQIRNTQLFIWGQTPELAVIILDCAFQKMQIRSEVILQIPASQEREQLG